MLVQETCANFLDVFIAYIGATSVARERCTAQSAQVLPDSGAYSFVGMIDSRVVVVPIADQIHQIDHLRLAVSQRRTVFNENGLRINGRLDAVCQQVGLDRLSDRTLGKVLERFIGANICQKSLFVNAGLLGFKPQSTSLFDDQSAIPAR
ncbi:hypothetical protein D9M71_465360 [compost metagenome]